MAVTYTDARHKVTHLDDAEKLVGGKADGLQPQGQHTLSAGGGGGGSSSLELEGFQPSRGSAGLDHRVDVPVDVDVERAGPRVALVEGDGHAVDDLGLRKFVHDLALFTSNTATRLYEF